MIIDTTNTKKILNNTINNHTPKKYEKLVAINFIKKM